MRRSTRLIGAATVLPVALAGLGLVALPAAAARPTPAVAPVLAAAAAVADGTGATPVPQVSLLPRTATSYPFGAADHQLVPQDLSRDGYVEEEFLVSGTANVYTWPTEGPAQVRTPDAPYTTRALVRRPAKGQHFSGNVVVEMLNPSNLFDLNIGWAVAHRQMVANGDAWVGITAKPVSVEALQKFDPQRYAALSFANPLPLDDPANCAVVAPDTRTTERGLAWDIYSQVGTWLKSDDPSNPLRYRSTTSQVEHAYGFGYSQTGGYLVDYINAIHPRVVATDGAPVYDAYLVAVAGGAFAGAYPLNQCEPAPAPTDPRRQIADVGVPVIRMMSQSDYLAGIGSRRADSDEPGDRYRHYEMAGAGHATPDELYYSAEPDDILAAGQPVPPLRCTEGERSRFPSAIFFDAALRNLDLWVREGIAPPRAEPILVRDGAPVLDEFGNVQGGLRSPYLDVPTSTWFGTATGASFCRIAGYEVKFSAAQLRDLYGTRGGYISEVRASITELVKDQWLTKDDARWLTKQATRVEIRR
ncbi:alpha/beta hydrolase domain-containing protein [Cellulomonas marina]|uniref:Alpha/beta hydrolase domain-containing protein n=1 Tax=Cellulomonas marina TaxID=988821 RepID=A0A1I0XBE8_9CELL|nr:alpha/beta hydrolase domain-containing protein [Cellulomonas marina]GIG29531.1 hypothetical protein Cma02nite_21310 [Cellulomonas marina]SFA97608.1 hypothetical protein SAMN05421867_104225 [Cellulomonas marina]